MIQSGVAIESDKNPMVVLFVDPDTRAVVLLNPADSARPLYYKAGPKVSNLGRIKAGDRVRATVAEELAVFVSKHGAPEAIKADARVLSVDPSYRLLTLQYPDGQRETFKVGLDVKLLQMEAGDDVMIRAVEMVALQVQAP